jgi:hypothetical protein
MKGSTSISVVPKKKIWMNWVDKFESLFVSLKICEQINKETYVRDYFFRKIIEISRKTQSEIIKCAQKILSNAQNFDVIFPGLDNLKRIHFNSIIEIQETK